MGVGVGGVGGWVGGRAPFRARYRLGYRRGPEIAETQFRKSIFDDPCTVRTSVIR